MKRRAIYIITVLALAVSATACARDKKYPEPPAYSGNPDGRFPLAATYAFYPPCITDLHFEWVKEAGFNIIGQNLPPAQLDSCLILAARHDLLVRAVPYGIADTLNIPRFVEKYGANPYIWGFSGADEPNASRFPYLKRMQEIYHELIPEKNVFINLLPAVEAKQLGSKDYRAHVEDYVRTVNPPFISFDCYPIKQTAGRGPYIDDCLWRTIEVVAEVSRESERRFWAFILCTAQPPLYPKQNRNFLRFQIFTALAYGAQGLSYFTYQMPDFDKGKNQFSDAPIDWDGNRTDVWYMVRDVNREVRNLEHVFLGAEVVDVSHTGPLPNATKRLWSLPAPFLSLDSEGEGVVVSHLRNGDDEYLLLVNKDVVRKQKVNLRRSRPVTRLYGDGREKEESKASITLDPGGYSIFRF